MNIEISFFLQTARRQGRSRTWSTTLPRSCTVLPRVGEAALAAAALAVSAARAGHVCLPLADWAGRWFPEGEAAAGASCFRMRPPGRRNFSRAASPGNPGLPPPYPGRGKLYLQRYHACEQRVRRICLPGGQEHDIRPMRWPVRPTFRAGRSRARLAAGGRGRGPGSILGHNLRRSRDRQDHTVVQLLVLLASAAGSRLRIGLAAPTGKAAARLQEALGKALAGLALPEAVRGGCRKPPPPCTGSSGTGTGRRLPHHRDNPLPLDVLVWRGLDGGPPAHGPAVGRAARAVPAHPAGDRDQLASVEAGSILADLCAAKRARFFAGVRRPAAEVAGAAAERWPARG